MSVPAAGAPGPVVAVVSYGDRVPSKLALVGEEARLRAACTRERLDAHLPQTEQVSVSKRQVGQAKCNPERWRLAVVSVPNDPAAEPEVRYLHQPFSGVKLHPAQTSVPLKVADLLTDASPPQ